MSDQQSKMDALYAGEYDSSCSGTSGFSSSGAGSIYSVDSMESCTSIFSTDTTYGSYGSWYGGDTHASGYEADCESNCSTKP